MKYDTRSDTILVGIYVRECLAYILFPIWEVDGVIQVQKKIAVCGILN